MKRIFTLLCILSLFAYSCSQDEQQTDEKEISKNQVITDNKEIISTDKAEENVEKEVEEVISSPSVSPKTEKTTKAKVAPSIQPTKKAIQKSQKSSNIISTKTYSGSTVEISLPIDLDKLSRILRDKSKNIVISSSIVKSKIATSDDDDDDGIIGFADNNPIDTSAENARIKTGAFDEMIGESRSGESVGIERGEDVPDYIRKPKPFVSDFTGYRIEIKTVYNKALSLNDDLFKLFGGVTYLNKTENSTTYYIGNFRNKIAVEDYMEKVLKNRYPDAKGVRFKNGEEVKYK